MSNNTFFRKFAKLLIAFGLANALIVLCLVYARVAGITFTEAQLESQGLVGFFGGVIPLFLGCTGLSATNTYD